MKHYKWVGTKYFVGMTAFMSCAQLYLNMIDENTTITMTSMNINYVTTVYILKSPQDSSLYMNWRSDR